MSAQRRRRRRRRRGGGSGSSNGGASNGGGKDRSQQNQQQGRSRSDDGGRGGGRRKRRKRSRRGGERITFERLMASYKPQPDTLMLEPDGQDLDQIIGELQSVWGVPQYPQEYRITIRVAEERQQRSGGNQAPKPAPTPATGPTGVQRERAPAAPRVGSPTSEGGGSKRRKRRRRRRGKGGGGNPPGSS